MSSFTDSRDIISIIQDKTRNRLSERGYQFCSVGWFDNKRAFQSSIGPNISDWSFLKKNGTKEKLLPFIRSKSNYEDYIFTRLNLSEGECIIFHWDTIHTEQIIGNKITKLALELRYEKL